MRLVTWVEVWSLVTSRDFGPWVWFERLSWLVALAGFPFLVYQVRVLQKDQRRLADELAMRPAIEFGFLPDERLLGEVVRWPKDVRGSRGPSRIAWRWFRLGWRWAAPPEPFRPQLPQQYTVEPKWSPGQNVSKPVSVTFVAVNVGARTARNVRFNLQLGSGDVAERKIAPTRDIHPRNVQPFTIEIQVPTGLTELPILATASMVDTLPQQFSVTLMVRASPPGPEG